MRRIPLLVSTVVFADAMLFGAIIPLVPGYADDFGLGKLEAGLLVGAYGAGALLGGIPAGLLVRRVGPRTAVVSGLLLLALASVAFALSGGPLALGLSRLFQGLASAATWAGALAWITTTTPRERRGQALGTTFGFAVLGFIVGPMFGAVAKVVGIRPSFAVVAVASLLLAAMAALAPRAPMETLVPGSVRRALRDAAFLAGLWLNVLPALFYGILDVVVPLALDEAGWGVFAVAAVFVVSGLVEVVFNPVLGRLSDRHGRLPPIRAALVAAAGVATALAFASSAAVIAVLVVACALSFGGFYTPGMALVADRAEAAGLSQGLGFGIMNSAWALGAMTGPTLGGALAGALGDPAPYLLGAVLCAGTLAAVGSVAGRSLETV